MMQPPFIFSIKQLTRYIKTLLERDVALQTVWVRGEISDLTYHSSGHLYFTLKDDSSRLRCAMFRSSASQLNFRPTVGMKVLAAGRVTLYEVAGQYQLIAETLAAEGAGALFLAFEALKAKLTAEGLFEQARKRPLPPHPNRVALLTSLDGAVVHDLVTVIRRRRPQTNLLIIPTPVQGAAAVPGIVHSFKLVCGCADVDLVVLARGGGSPEDLIAFNSEEVARAIVACPVPVVSAVGHEVDFTIADFVADLRAPTPSVAGELVVPETSHDYLLLKHLEARRLAALKRRLEVAQRELSLLTLSRVFSFPEELVSDRAQRLDDLMSDLQDGLADKLQDYDQRLARAQVSLQALSPLAVLQRGYAVVRHQVSGKVVRSVTELAVADEAKLEFLDGSARVRIEEVAPGDVD